MLDLGGRYKIEPEFCPHIPDTDRVGPANSTLTGYGQNCLHVRHRIPIQCDLGWRTELIVQIPPPA